MESIICSVGDQVLIMTTMEFCHNWNFSVKLKISCSYVCLYYANINNFQATKFSNLYQCLYLLDDSRFNKLLI